MAFRKSAGGGVKVAIEVMCPTCNTVGHFDEVERDADCFCQTCDYPLFWARPRHTGPGAVPAASPAELPEGGRRRLPGTEGWAISEQLVCPRCFEPNLTTEGFCVRCGADLHPRPPAPVYLPPPPVPRPVPVQPVLVPSQRRHWWPWVAAACLVVIGLVAWLLVAYA